MSSSVESLSSNQKENISVVVRVRPLNDTELKRGDKKVLTCANGRTVLPPPSCNRLVAMWGSHPPAGPAEALSLSPSRPGLACPRSCDRRKVRLGGADDACLRDFVQITFNGGSMEDFGRPPTNMQKSFTFNAVADEKTTQVHPPQSFPITEP